MKLDKKKTLPQNILKQEETWEEPSKDSIWFLQKLENEFLVRLPRNQRWMAQSYASGNN